MPTPSGMSGSQYNIKNDKIEDIYTQNVNSQQSNKLKLLSNKRTLRDLSTGLLKRNGNNHLTNSKEYSLKINE